MLKITSRNNEKIKNAAKLGTDSSYRRKTGMFFLEGLRLCCDAAENGIEPGTKFEDLGDDFVCPLCGVGKDDFSEV